MIIPLIIWGAVLLAFLAYFWILADCFVAWWKSKRLSFEGGNKEIVKAIINRAKFYKPYEWSTVDRIGPKQNRVTLPHKAIWTPPIILGDHEFRVTLFKRTFGKVGYILYQDEVYSTLRCMGNSYVLSDTWKYWEDHNFKVHTEMERAFFEKTSKADSGALTVVE